MFTCFDLHESLSNDTSLCSCYYTIHVPTKEVWNSVCSMPK